MLAKFAAMGGTLMGCCKCHEIRKGPRNKSETEAFEVEAKYLEDCAQTAKSIYGPKALRAKEIVASSPLPQAECETSISKPVLSIREPYAGPAECCDVATAFDELSGASDCDADTGGENAAGAPRDPRDMPRDFQKRGAATAQIAMMCKEINPEASVRNGTLLADNPVHCHPPPEDLEPMLAYDSPDSAVVIFDWDDTLFPTQFLADAGVPLNEPALPSRDLIVDGVPLVDILAKHAVRIKAVLEKARSVARVAIITLARKPWVTRSSDVFLPGLKMGDLLRTLGVRIYYARDHLKKHDGQLRKKGEEGVDMLMVAKRRAFIKCLRKFYGRQALRMNVISIGDSMAEADAVKDVIWTACEQHGVCAGPLCKTVKLLDNPTAAELNDQLLLVSLWLRNMAVHDEDFDIIMDEIEDCLESAPFLKRMAAPGAKRASTVADRDRAANRSSSGGRTSASKADVL